MDSGARLSVHSDSEMPSEPIFGDRKSGLRDRRASYRFPLRLSVKYRPLGNTERSEWMPSESVNISSAGILFKTPDAVPPGQSLEALIAWPVFLDKRIPLKLVIKGLVVRNADNSSAMRFETYEFRTCHPAEAKTKTTHGG
jgi:c-di-GMP-binding flagellar brake protein YcgR